MRVEVAARYPKMVVLWCAQLMSLGALFMLSAFLGGNVGSEAFGEPNTVLVVAITALGTFLVGASFAVKRKFLERSVERQDIELVHRAFVIAAAMCEISAMLGLIERFVLNDPYYFVLFLIAGAGIVFHFPRRENLVAASLESTPTDPFV